MEKLLEVKHLKKFYYGKKKLFSKETPSVKAINDVSFNVYRGETLGVVGESGCGKSTMGRTVLRLLEPTSGEILYEGKDICKLSKEEMRLMRQKMQIIFQDPYASLNPRMTVKELIQAPLDAFTKLSAEEKLEKVKEIMALVGLQEEWLEKYPHEFSGGQRQRIVIARALILNPEFIFCDEPVSALDVSVRAQVLNLLKDIQKEKKLTYLFVSHDLSVVRFLCDRIMVMYLGRVVELGSRNDIYEHAGHPYTQILLSAIPVADVDVKTKPVIIEGDVPSPYSPPSGCLFHTRCPKTCEKCKKEIPELKEVSKGHFVACHLYAEDKK